MSLPRALEQIEMQTTSSRFGTWVSNSISNNDDDYAKQAFCKDVDLDEMHLMYVIFGCLWNQFIDGFLAFWRNLLG